MNLWLAQNVNHNFSYLTHWTLNTVNCPRAGSKVMQPMMLNDNWMLDCILVFFQTSNALSVHIYTQFQFYTPFFKDFLMVCFRHTFKKVKHGGAELLATDIFSVSKLFLANKEQKQSKGGWIRIKGWIFLNIDFLAFFKIDVTHPALWPEAL